MVWGRAGSSSVNCSCRPHQRHGALLRPTISVTRITPCGRILMRSGEIIFDGNRPRLEAAARRAFLNAVVLDGHVLAGRANAYGLLRCRCLPF